MQIILDSILQAISTLLIGLIGAAAAVYIKNFESKLKKNTIKEEIKKYINWVNESETTKLLPIEKKKEIVIEMVSFFAEENEIKISQREIELLVENELNLLSKLENIKLKLISGG